MAAIDRVDTEKICALLRYAINWKFLFVAEQASEPGYDLLAAGEETGILLSAAFPSEQTWSLTKDKVAGFDAQDFWLRIRTDRELSATYYVYHLTQPGRELLRVVGRQKMSRRNTFTSSAPRSSAPDFKCRLQIGAESLKTTRSNY